MARRRDPGMVSFDVSGDPAGASGPVDAVNGPDVALTRESAAPGNAPRSGLPDRWRAVSRRRRALVWCVALAAVAAVVGAQQLVAEHGRLEVLRAAPGGVLSLDGELVEAWVRETSGGIHAVLPGGVLLLADGGGALGIDAVTGEQLWRADLGADLECGPRPAPTSRCTGRRRRPWSPACTAPPASGWRRCWTLRGTSPGS